MLRHRLAPTCALLVVSLVTACGSTVPLDATARLSEPGSDLSAPNSVQPPAGPGMSASADTVPGSGAATSRVPGGHGIASQPGAFGQQDGNAFAPGSQASGKPVSNARGVTDTTISIGLEYIKGADDARKNAGFAGVTSGDQHQQLEILVAEINRTGGFAGRKLVPVYHVYDANSGNSNQTNEEAACATFVQDNKVFAVISAINHTDTFLACLTKVDVPYISAPGLTINDEEVFRKYPLHVELNAVSLSQQGEMFGKPLASTGYYDAGAKVGLLTFDQPNFNRAVKDHLLPALARVGQKVEDQVALAFPQSTADTGPMAAAIGNAVLRFRQRGITHVLITDVSALTTVLFLGAAANQKYYPRYGWLSPNGGQAAADLVTDKRSLEGTVELGWYPTIDLNAANETIVPSGASSCAKIFAAKGYSPQNRNEETVLQLQCEIFRYSQKAGTAATVLTPQSFVEAFADLQGVVRPASTYQIDLKGRHDGAAAYRVQRWVASCVCFKADPGLRPVH